MLHDTRNTLKLALVGNPNAGKSSVFNRLTGLHQKTGNYPGVTVDKKTGGFELVSGQKVAILDLPGTYSIHPNTLDEQIVLQTLTNPDPSHRPDAIFYVADATNLERHFLLLSQIIDLQYPIFVGLTMPDILEKKNMTVDLAAISRALHTPVALINGRTGDGLDKLKAWLGEKELKITPNWLDAHVFHKEAIDKAEKIIGNDNPFVALLALQHADMLKWLSPAQRSDLKNIATSTKFQTLNMQVEETMSRFDTIVPLVQKVTSKSGHPSPNKNDIADRILTHPFWGLVIFMVLLYGMFQATFALASYPMDAIEAVFAQISGYIGEFLPDAWWSRLITEGLLPGLSGVLVFIPQIAILFFLISILEEVGYMSRAVFLSDSVMRRFGLSGRSMVSLFSGMACAVPAIMATRTISNWKERLVTILVTPFISCSARIPVYTVLIAFVVPSDKKIGIFGAQGLLMFALYWLGAITALMAAWVLKKILRTREISFLTMELPPYKMPHWKNIAITVFDKVKTFVHEAGKIILMISLLLWVLASYGPSGKMDTAEAQIRTNFAQKNLPIDSIQLKRDISAARLATSYMGIMGKTIEPAIKPLGFDWKIGIALIASFAAREVFVGTMATIYSVGESDDTNTLHERLAAEINPETGKPRFSMPVAASLLVFYAFAMQCISTLAVVRRETKTYKWAILQFLAMTAIAYLSSWAVYVGLS
jgi:ferrous iron transport protein B